MAGPLEGLRVLDFGQYLAGPLGPMLLADLGADVIKVEPIGGDAMRRFVVGSFMGCQRGKRDIAIDLKQDEGRRLALELVATADVVHHNMTLGTADRLGIGYEHCRAVRADVLYCNNYMYGPIGPLGALGGIDPLGQAAAGLEWEQGPVPEGNRPQWYRYGHGDAASAIPSTLGVLLALRHRNRTGEGQSMWSSIFQGTMLFTLDSWLGPDGTPSPRPTLDREQLGLDALYRLYETADGWVQLAAVGEGHWPALVTALGTPELVEDDRFATPAARLANRAALTALLDERFRAGDTASWLQALDDAGVPAEASVDSGDGDAFLFDDELVELGIVTEYVHPRVGRTRQVGNLITFSDTPGRQERPTPRVGEDTREILAELGYDEAAIDDLHERGIVRSPGDDYEYTV